MHASKIATRFAAAAAAVALLFPLTSRAADGSAKTEKMPSYPALMKMKPTDVMHMMDADKTDTVTREEFMKFYEAVFERLDRDHNRQLAEPEFTDAG